MYQIKYLSLGVAQGSKNCSEILLLVVTYCTISLQSNNPLTVPLAEKHQLSSILCDLWFKKPVHERVAWLDIRHQFIHEGTMVKRFVGSVILHCCHIFHDSAIRLAKHYYTYVHVLYSGFKLGGNLLVVTIVKPKYKG